jgi:hypothetical protein
MKSKLEKLVSKSWRKIIFNLGVTITFVSSLASLSFGMELNEWGWPEPPVGKAVKLGYLFADCAKDIYGIDSLVTLYAVNVNSLSEKYKQAYNIFFSENNFFYFATVQTLTGNNFKPVDDFIRAYFIDNKGKLILPDGEIDFDYEIVRPAYAERFNVRYNKNEFLNVKFTPLKK